MKRRGTIVRQESPTRSDDHERYPGATSTSESRPSTLTTEVGRPVIVLGSANQKGGDIDNVLVPIEKVPRRPLHIGREERSLAILDRRMANHEETVAAGDESRLSIRANTVTMMKALRAHQADNGLELMSLGIGHPLLSSGKP